VHLEDLVVEDQDVVEQLDQVIHPLYLLHKEIMEVLQVVLETAAVAEAVQVQLVQVQERQPMVVQMEELEQQQILQEVH
tara:strand:+ start:173 stop:409 length:237 start_codon:yes stop_codon:yes gene_type:complete